MQMLSQLKEFVFSMAKMTFTLKWLGEGGGG